ncbi:MAG TPA: GGDEF domain-containing protein, partial [Acidobacteriaceae bacterium]
TQPRTTWLRSRAADAAWCAVLATLVLLAARQQVLAGVEVAGIALGIMALRWRRQQRARVLLQARLQSGSNITPASPTGACLKNPLTGIATRAGLETSLQNEWRRVRSPGEPTSLVLIGVDDFSGLLHADGAVPAEVTLLTLARALARMLPRGSDLFAHHDASTFAALLPGTDLPGALRVAARLRWTILRLGIVRGHTAATSPGFVTASMGVAVQREPACEGALLSAAQQALHAASARGCDQLEYTSLDSVSPAGDPVAATPALSALHRSAPLPAQSQSAGIA